MCATCTCLGGVNCKKWKPGKEREGTEESTSGGHEGKEAINKTQFSYRDNSESPGGGRRGGQNHFFNYYYYYYHHHHQDDAQNGQDKAQDGQDETHDGQDDGSR